MKGRRIIRTFLITLGLCYLLAMLLVKIFETRLVYFPSRIVGGAANQLGRPSEDAFIPVENGEQINAWYFPAHPGQVQTSDRAILVCHGNAGTMAERLDLANLLLKPGASVMLFDYRGYGRSTGQPGEENTYRDAQAAWRWLKAKGFAATNIIVYGESLGGGVATELAARETAGGLILQSTFTSIPDLGAEIYPWLPIRLIASIKYDNLRKLPGIKAPVLILHSRQDRLIRFHHAERNFAAANEPKYFCEIEGDHNDGFYASQAKILAAVTDFLRRPGPLSKP